MAFEMRKIAASGRISEIGYDGDTKQVRAVFPNGKSAVYDGVPEEVFQSVAGVPSVGTAFGDLIVKGGYPWHYE